MNSLICSSFDNIIREFNAGSGRKGKLYSLPALEKSGIGRISRLPISIRIVLESVLRNCDGKKITEEHVRQLANGALSGPAPERSPLLWRVSCCRTLQGFLFFAILRPCAARLPDGEGPSNNRASGPCGSDCGPFGTDRLLRPARSSAEKHGNGV